MRFFLAVTGLSWVGWARVRDREVEDATAPASRLHPDAAAVALDDPLADRQSHAGAGVVVARVQAPEHLEHPRGMKGVDPDPVVTDHEVPVALAALGGEVNARQAVG